MNQRQKHLKEQACEWWLHVPPDVSTRLRAELKQHPSGTALIELDRPRYSREHLGDRTQARVIVLTLGTLVRPECRYLSQVDLKEEARP